MKESIDLAQFTADYQALIVSQRSLQLATINDQGAAEISYAPYVHIDGQFFIYVSNLAKHTHNLLRSQQASVLFIQPEAEAANVFARHHLTFNCLASEINRGDELFNRVLENMRNRFGAVIDMLRTLPDFHLIALKPSHGHYVAGFAKAFDIDLTNGSLQHVID